MGKFSFLKNLAGGNQPPAIDSYPVAATQALKAGDLVVLASGKVAKAGNGAAAPFGVMAQDSASAADGTPVRVYLIMPGQVWHATADADASSVVLGGGTYDINDTTQTVDIGDSSGGAIRVMALRDGVTDVEITFSKGVLF